MEALTIWKEEKGKRLEHGRLCAAAGKEVREGGRPMMAGNAEVCPFR